MSKRRASILLAAINFAVMQQFGIRRKEAPRRLRRMHRRLATRGYRGQRKYEKALRRFIRACRDHMIATTPITVELLASIRSDVAAAISAGGS